MVAKALFSSRKDDWCTPNRVLDPVRRFAGDIGIALDPCSNASSIVNAKRAYSLADGQDGLALTWETDVCGVVFVNPPYGRAPDDVGPWVKKASETWRHVFVLVPARVDAKWWQREATKAAAVCFWKGRIKFLGGKHAAPFPSAMLYFGINPGRFCEDFRPYGWTVRA
jgi:hypothetical protein